MKIALMTRHGSDQKIVNLILATINGVQALYHFNSLDREMTIR